MKIVWINPHRLHVVGQCPSRFPLSWRALFALLLLGAFQVWPTSSLAAATDDVTAFAATAATPYQIDLLWQTNSGTNIRGFNLWRSVTQDTGYVKLDDARLPIENLNGMASYFYADIGVAAGPTYFYELETFHGDGSSTWNGPISSRLPDTCTPISIQPRLIAPLDGQRVEGVRVTLGWTSSACQAQFRIIMRRSSISGPVVGRANGWPTAVYVTEPLTAGQSYYWRVKACNRCSCARSDWGHFMISGSSFVRLQSR